MSSDLPSLYLPTPLPGPPDNDVNDTHNSTQEEAKTVPVARFGGCWDGVVGSEIQCVEACSVESGKTFYSGSQLGDQCAPADIPAQRCNGDGSISACTMGGCPEGTTIEPANASSTCNLIEDTSTKVATLYGGCQNVADGKINGCFWSQKDCHPVEEKWLIPDDLIRVLSQEKKKPYCDCSDVQVGACKSNTSDRMVCAVDATQCAGPGEYFVTARMLSDFPSTFGNVDCRLCSEGSTTSNDNTTLVFLEVMSQVRANSNNNSTKQDQNESHLTISLTIASLAFFSIFVSAILFISRRRSINRPIGMNVDGITKDLSDHNSTEEVDDTNDEEVVFEDLRIDNDKVIV